ncbi:aldo/keto reductase [Streptomyces nigrescens]
MDLQREGKIRHIGLDSIDADELTRAREIAPIASVQNRYNLLDRAAEDVLELCEKQGTAFLPWFPLGNGTLTGDAGTTLAAVAARHDATPGQIALAWLLHHSPVLLPTPGTGSPAHLDENLAAAHISLTEGDLAQLDALA